MFTPANQSHFTLHLAGLEHDLQVLAFDGREAISQPYRFDVEQVSERPDLDLEGLLQQRAFLALVPNGQGIHGLIQAAEQGESGRRLTRYRLSIAPQLAWLALRSNQRIFQHLTVPQIIARLLEEHGNLEGTGYRFQLAPAPTPCVTTACSTTRRICTSSSACARRKASTTTSATARTATCCCSATIRAPSPS